MPITTISAKHSVLHMGKPRRKRNAGMDTRAEPLRVLQLIALLRWRDMVIDPEYNANVPFASAAFDTCDRESPLHPHSLSAATRLY